MQPATMRRLLVFGVCLVGIGCLYLVPSMAGSSRPGNSGVPRHDLPRPSPAAVTLATTAAAPRPPAPLTVASGGATTATTARSAPATRIGALTGGEAGFPGPAEDSVPSTRSAVTAAAPGHDDEPPGPVGELEVVNLDPRLLTVSWPAVRDDGGVVTYQVRLNGFRVLATQQTRATLGWFNDSDTHVVQVRAQDAAGNEGPSSPTLMVSRPSAAAVSRSATLSPTSAEEDGS